MKQLFFPIVCLIIGSIMSSWALNYRQPWSFHHNDHSLTNAVNHVFSKIYNLNYISIGNNDDYIVRDNYQCLMASGFTDSVKFKIGDTIFMYFNLVSSYLLWNNSEKHPTYYQISGDNHKFYKGKPKIIKMEYLKFFTNWDSISAREFHNPHLRNEPDNPDDPDEIIRFIITKKGMRIDAFEY